MRILYSVCLIALMCSCSTLDQSMRLGAVTGALAGAAAMSATTSVTGQSISGEQIAQNATIGMGIGLITSYFIHKQVASDRQAALRQTELYFGDLPPSPFVLPAEIPKKGGRP